MSDTEGTMTREAYLILPQPERYAASMKFANTEGFPTIARTADHNQRAADAVQRTKDWYLELVKEGLATGAGQADNESDNSDDTNPGMIGRARQDPRTPAEQAAGTKHYFIEQLPYCDAMNIKFEMKQDGRQEDRRKCYCPLGKHLEPWRQIFELDELNMRCESTKSTEGLRAHLHSKADGQPNNYCPWHGITEHYLSVMYPSTRNDNRKRPARSRDHNSSASTGSKRPHW